jgi:hypothetical protein
MKYILTAILAFMVSGMPLASVSAPWVDAGGGDSATISMQTHLQALDKQVQDKKDEPEPQPQPTEPPDSSC